MRRLQLAIVAAALIVAAQANATLTTLEFTDSGDSGGNGGSRRLTAQAEGDGSYSIVSGLSHLTSGPSAGANGTFVPNPDGPGAAPWGARVCGGPGREGVDDQMFPSGAAGVGVGGVGVAALCSMTRRILVLILSAKALRSISIMRVACINWCSMAIQTNRGLQLTQVGHCQPSPSPRR